MIILTYKHKVTPSYGGLPQPTNIGGTYIVVRFANEAAEQARAAAIRATQDGHSEVFLSTAFERFTLAPNVEVTPVP